MLFDARESNRRIVSFWLTSMRSSAGLRLELKRSYGHGVVAGVLDRNGYGVACAAADDQGDAVAQYFSCR